MLRGLKRLSTRHAQIPMQTELLEKLLTREMPYGKYKGRINNYLSKRGYDLVKERKAWYERIKARGGKI